MGIFTFRGLLLLKNILLFNNWLTWGWLEKEIQNETTRSY
ncbi:hypothetical protein GECvBN6_gp124c [Salmonella phage GEC_vB_N6]|nr:hypothetical protein GECvBN6_gp124c [Salmonella phage GEC_vB_N6]WDS51129.1 hypothetical protein SeF3a_046 [Salmonella phage SeF3a]